MKRRALVESTICKMAIRSLASVLKPLLIAVKLLLSCLLIWYVFGKIDGAAAAAELRKLPLWAIGIAVFMLALQYLVAAWRLKRLLSVVGATCNLGAALDACVIGAFFSQTLISFVGGDAMRVWRVSRQNVAVDAATRAVMLDRIFGFVGLIALIVCGLPVLFQTIHDMRVNVAVVGLVGVAVAACLTLIFFRRLPPALRSNPVLAFVARLSESTGNIVVNLASLRDVLAASFAIQLFNIAVIYAFVLGLGVELSLLHALVLIPPVLFLSMMPVSLAGWGVRETAMVAALGAVGVSAAQSLALSISYGVALVLVSLPGGLLWFYNRNASGGISTKAA
jgi:uncharacterized membrane protein YbhN (UPF0104 family)